MDIDAINGIGEGTFPSRPVQGSSGPARPATSRASSTSPTPAASG